MARENRCIGTKQGEKAYREVKLRGCNIISCIRRLHDHLLPLQHRVRKRQLIARAARWIRTRYGGEAVGEVIVHRPRRLRRAGECGTALAAGLCVRVRKWIVADVADADNAGGLAFPFPGARGFAAVLNRRISDVGRG